MGVGQKWLKGSGDLTASSGPIPCRPSYRQFPASSVPTSQGCSHPCPQAGAHLDVLGVELREEPGGRAHRDWLAFLRVLGSRGVPWSPKKTVNSMCEHQGHLSVEQDWKSGTPPLLSGQRRHALLQQGEQAAATGPASQAAAAGQPCAASLWLSPCPAPCMALWCQGGRRVPAAGARPAQPQSRGVSPQNTHSCRTGPAKRTSVRAPAAEDPVLELGRISQVGCLHGSLCS